MVGRQYKPSTTELKINYKMPTLRKIKRAAMQPHKPTQIAAHLILPNRTQSPPTTRQQYLMKDLKRII
jgi:hypothetical protein